MPTEGAGSISELNQAAPTSTGPAGEGDDELRQLKAVLLASFPALDGLISNTGATGGAGDTDPPDAATYSKLFADVRAIQGSGASVPVGMIAMWGGLETQIPAGWVICDGLNGTPDLRGRFILGSADTDTVYATGSSGGNAWDGSGAFPVLNTASGGQGTGSATFQLPDHTIAEANLPEHSHKLFGSQANPSVGSATVGTTEAATVDGSGHSDNNKPYAIAPVPTNPGTIEPTLARSSTYGAASPVGLSHPATDITIDGIEHSHAYIPYFYALAYIQFQGV